MSNPLDSMDDKFLRYNLLLTQGIILVAALIGSWFVHSRTSFGALFHFPGWLSLGIASAFALVVVLISVGSEKIFPKHWVDDGEINQRIFRNISITRTAILCIIVGFSEEFLFRGVVQYWIGNGWTSLFFTLIHVRYLSKPLLLVMVFGTSYGLGSLFETQHSLIAPIVAHSLLDFLSALIIQRRR